MIKMDKVIGLIAGEGELPLEIAGNLSRTGYAPAIYTFMEDIPGIRALSSRYVRITEPSLGKLADDLLNDGIDAVMLAGRVPKALMFRPDMMDSVLRSVIASLNARDDHSLLGAIVAYFESRGIQVLSYREVIPGLMAPLGHIAGRSPDTGEKDDILYGIRIASAIVPLSFGQTVIVRERSVVAVEAMEGTDAAIERAGRIAGAGVVVKMMRPDQDERYDLPTVGPGTLSQMRDWGITCLAVEAGRTIILGADSFKESAESWNIAVTGIDRDLSL